MLKFLVLGNKTNLVISLIIIRINTEPLKKVIGKFLWNYFTFTFALMVTVALKIVIFQFLSNAKQMCIWKKGKGFGNKDLKPFT